MQTRLPALLMLLLACTPKHSADTVPPLFRVAERATPVGPDGALGTRTNPVRAGGPFGEREFLARVRCPDAAAPDYERLGSGPQGEDGHILDTYLVHCPPDGPTVTVVMDMYHGGYREQASLGPFTVLPDLPARLATGCPPQVHQDPDSSASYIFTMFEVERPAHLPGDEPPAYEVGTEGGAWVRFVVDTTGAPELNTLRVVAVEPSGLRRHVREAVAALHFRPAIHHEDCVVRQWMEGPLEFR